MNIRNSTIKAVIVFLMLFLSPIVSVGAQEEETSSIINSPVAISTLNINNSTIQEQKDNKFWIKFDVGNGDGIEAGIRPVITLYNTTEDDKRELVHVYRDNNIYVFEENTTMLVLVTYQAPQNLNGEYEMYVSLENSQHLFLGTLFVGKIILQSVEKNTNDLPSFTNELEQKRFLILLAIEKGLKSKRKIRQFIYSNNIHMSGSDCTRLLKELYKKKLINKTIQQNKVYNQEYDVYSLTPQGKTQLSNPKRKIQNKQEGGTE